jgi:hypothetical protein
MGYGFLGFFVDGELGRRGVDLRLNRVSQDSKKPTLITRTESTPYGLWKYSAESQLATSTRRMRPTICATRSVFANFIVAIRRTGTNLAAVSQEAYLLSIGHRRDTGAAAW